MKFEFSAGGVVFKRGKTADIYILVSQHAQHHGWVFPKGLIGDKEHLKGESKEETAVREVKEETGINAQIIQSLEAVSYWYVFDKQKIKKTVYYFIMKHLGGNFDDRDHEMEAVEWVPIEKVFDKLTYPSDKKVFEAAKGIIEKIVNNGSIA